jgi:GT2 family glycosyltransferase
MSNKELSIVIVSFNAKAILLQCLESILNAEIGVPHEIIVVDNASTDGSPDMIETHFKDVVLIKNNGNLLFAKANNQGINIAEGKYLLLLNSDTIVQKGAIDLLIKFLSDYPKAAAVGPKVLNVDGTLQSKGNPPPSVHGTIFRWMGFHKIIPLKRLHHFLFPKLYWYPDEIVRVGWISGCCMLIRKEIINKIGGFCEDLIFYGEDVEWCYRAIKAHYEVWYVPTASIVHIGGGSTSEPIKKTLQDETLLLQNYTVLVRKTVGLFRGVVMSCIASFVIYFTYLLLYYHNRMYAKEKLRQAKWEIVAFKYLLANGGKESGA